ncbi:HK97 gp10 family phage protein [Bifidobacterium sp. ESL0769]|uniref:HK97 gp10 family phage protein n=1 Tax=Bifidobacterium sp. ESL0769 TaxID=2983229 RepID=UPI0023F8BE90|nr:HK97 gp10 family phage protein [Bifidobacterium sp. ESL0769]WEV67969.1 HK97 gp10 family phage protein [Bifidobacterium sp. ESL0769]
MAKRSLIEIKGASQLARTLRKAGADAKDLKDVNRKAADVVVPVAKGGVPVRSHRLENSIRSGATQKAGVIRAGRKSVPYAGPIHWGWPGHHIKPHTFLTDAAKSTEPEWTELYEQEIKKIIEQVQGE